MCENYIKKNMTAHMKGEKLIQAIRNGKYELAEKLLKRGCDPDCRINDVSKCTPALIIAVTCESLKCLQLLLKYGATVDACDKLGMTAAMYAADKGLTEFLKTLVDKNADLNKVNVQGANALMMAAKWDKHECVHFILEHLDKYDINRQDREGKTALMYAAMHGSTECLNLLIDAGADLNITDSEKGFTALFYALEHHSSDCANFLLDNKTSINILGIGKESQTTPITLAFRNSKVVGDFSMIERLLVLGADMTLSRLDQNFLHEMIARDKKKIVRLMVINGCPPFDRRCYEHFFKFSEHKRPISPLCVALLSGFYDIAKYFIVNNFLTKYDITVLPNDPGLNQKLQEEDMAEALAILNLICSMPQSLKVLCFVNIKDALGSNARNNIVESGLPEQLQSELLFKKWSQICLLSWHELSLDEDQNFETCKSCTECNEEGLRVKKRRNHFM